MSHASNVVSIHPYFKAHPGKLGQFKAAMRAFVEKTTGETNNLHQAMIAMQEASVAFSLMVEMRNKLVEGYQEVMRMQV